MASTIVRGLWTRGFLRPKVEEATVVARVTAILTKSFAEEAALAEEAERLAQTHAGKMVGMDHHRIVRGIMERLARERNFPL